MGLCLEITASPAQTLQIAALAKEEYITGGTLNLNWEDCGDSTYHAKITNLSPSQLTLGQNTHIAGSGNLDKAESAGSGAIKVKAGPISENYKLDLCSGKTINLPLGLGSVVWAGLTCPVAPGAVNIGVDIKLSSVIPAGFAKATIDVTGTSDTGDNLLCLEIIASPAQTIQIAALAKEEYITGGTLNLNWEDCGDSTYHAKITNLSPSQLTLGQNTHITGSGNLDKAESAGSGAIKVKAGPISENYKLDLCAAKTINLPLGLGSVVWAGLTCPVAPGAVSIGVDIKLSSVIPAGFAKATIDVTGTSATGDNLLCLEIIASPAQAIIAV